MIVPLACRSIEERAYCMCWLLFDEVGPEYLEQLGNIAWLIWKWLGRARRELLLYLIWSLYSVPSILRGNSRIKPT